MSGVRTTHAISGGMHKSGRQVFCRGTRVIFSTDRVAVTKILFLLQRQRKFSFAEKGFHWTHTFTRLLRCFLGSKLAETNNPVSWTNCPSELPRPCSSLGRFNHLHESHPRKLRTICLFTPTVAVVTQAAAARTRHI